eukprot:gene5824-4151_t
MCGSCGLSVGTIHNANMKIQTKGRQKVAKLIIDSNQQIKTIRGMRVENIMKLNTPKKHLLLDFWQRYLNKYFLKNIPLGRSGGPLKDVAFARRQEASPCWGIFSKTLQVNFSSCRNIGVCVLVIFSYLIVLPEKIVVVRGNILNKRNLKENGKLHYIFLIIILWTIGLDYMIEFVGLNISIISCYYSQILYAVIWVYNCYPNTYPLIFVCNNLPSISMYRNYQVLVDIIYNTDNI